MEEIHTFLFSVGFFQNFFSKFFIEKILLKMKLVLILDGWTSKKITRFPNLDYAILQPSKLKLI